MVNNSKSGIKLVVIAILLFFPMAVSAAPVLWVGDRDGQLGTVDLDTGDVAVIGQMDVPMQDIAFDPNGDLWGVSHTSLYKIDKMTAELALVGKLSETRGSSLVFDTEGILYTAYTTGLYTIDTTTGKASEVGFSGHAYRQAQDLAFIDSDLYMSARRHGEVLFRVDKTDGATTMIGGITGGGVMKGLASPNRADLYGLTYSEILIIDPENAESYVLMDYSGLGLGEGMGCAFESEAAVPLPAAVWFLGSGLLAMAGIRKRRIKKQ